ncbi:hypothetical protein EB796_000028 [Bugula neritina]|uniref:Uncharacterized protein n=1 Tax=Bugula neritina TaxID=10212 RepID=A0A7J7KU62_BUGNE|nr:hypothetical protein EB796_000028 [Bugula neritina]
MKFTLLLAFMAALITMVLAAPAGQPSLWGKPINPSTLVKIAIRALVLTFLMQNCCLLLYILKNLGEKESEVVSVTVLGPSLSCVAI